MALFGKPGAGSRPRREQRIQDEIRRRVLKESALAAEQRQARADEQLNLDAVSEVADLPAERIEENAGRSSRSPGPYARPHRWPPSRRHARGGGA